MKIHNLIQGSPEWLAYRAQHFNASDAPAMMGCSPYKTRADLLRELHTGVAAEVDIGTQKRFDNGHRAEALARPLAEEFIGAELYPVTGSEGRLSASFDGLTLDETQCFEHKALNAELRAAFDAMTDAFDKTAPNRDLPVYHRVQMEQQLLVSGAERVLFMASEWTADGELVEERHCWYYPDAKLRAAIVDGWAQFERDLAAYVLPASAPAAPVGQAPETLPALRIEVRGEVTASNLDAFKATALAAIRAVRRDLQTDQDFADAEQAVRWCADVESRIDAAKQHALSQTASIDALFRALDDISAEARRVRLDVDKLVTRRKAEVKDEAVAKARRALDAHVAELHAELAPMRLQPVPADFAGAIKGKRSIASMQDALDAVLASAKIAADAQARGIRANVAAFQQQAAGLEFLFADLGQIVHKAADDFAAVLQARIAAHRAAEAERERKRAEAEQARIAAEAARLAAQQVEDARVAALARQREQDAAAEAVRIASQPLREEAPTLLSGLRGMAQMPAGETSETIVEKSRAAWTAPPAATEPATLRLGTICERLGLTMTAAFVADTLGIAPARTDGRASLYTETQFQALCDRLASHAHAMATLYEREPA